MSRSRAGQHRKVLEATAVVAQALGGDARTDQPPKYVPMTPTREAVATRDESVAVLTLREAAMRLSMGIWEVDRMVASGRLTSLVAGWTVVLPVEEVEALQG